MNSSTAVTPEQIFAMLGLLGIFGLILGGPIFAWILYIVRPFKKWEPVRPVGFGVVGFVDIVLTLFLMFVLTLGANIAWRIALGNRLDSIRDSMIEKEPEDVSKSKNSPMVALELDPDLFLSSDDEQGSIDETEDSFQDETTSENALDTDTATDSPKAGDGVSQLGETSERGGSDESEATDGTKSAEAPSKREFDPLTPIVILTLQLASLLAVSIAIAWIWVRSGCRLEHLGFRTDQLLSNIGFGIQVYLMFMPVLMAINIIAGLTTRTEYNHPVLDLLKHAPVTALVMAAIIAPLTEEIAFRAILIGWLESVQFAKNRPLAFLVGELVGDPRSSALKNHELANPSATAALQNSVVTAAVVQPDWLVEESSDQQAGAEAALPWWPALLSGFLFGMAHFSYGVSWVPLVFFGVLLGRIYQIRRSVLSTIAIHMVHNAIMIAVAWLSFILTKQ